MSKENGKIAIFDLDSLIHIVANVQFKSGNRDNAEQTKDHIRRFYATVRTSSDCQYSISFYQKQGHKNFRNNLLPEYKNNRITSEAVTLWKPVIIEAFEELGAYGLEYVESDDVCGVLGKLLGNDKIVIISSDKDMQQISGDHYNPFKKGSASDPTRKSYVTKYLAERFLWEQVLSGDGGDMPLTLCGIEGIGPKKAHALCDQSTPYGTIIAQEYTKKYGADIGLKRAAITYKMVRILNGTPEDSYAGIDAVNEINAVIHSYKEYIVNIADDAGALFGIKPTKGSDLFT